LCDAIIVPSWSIVAVVVVAAAARHTSVRLSCASACNFADSGGMNAGLSGGCSAQHCASWNDVRKSSKASGDANGRPSRRTSP
jgi:hypothetical protein